MLWVKAFHLIFMVMWLAGLFYLPRLFVYHANTKDALSNERFKTMERRLYYGITTPGGLLATFFGLWLLSSNLSFYFHQGWWHAKLALVFLLWGYHFSLLFFLNQFKRDHNTFSALFYRCWNEVPTFLLSAIVILVIVKPF